MANVPSGPSLDCTPHYANKKKKLQHADSQYKIQVYQTSAFKHIKVHPPPNTACNMHISSLINMPFRHSFIHVIYSTVFLFFMGQFLSYKQNVISTLHKVTVSNSDSVNHWMRAHNELEKT
jgi:hypothetical protein